MCFEAAGTASGQMVLQFWFPGADMLCLHRIKPNNDIEIRRLAEFEELQGQLLEVKEFEGFAVAVFTWGSFLLPRELMSKLREMEGKKIAILRLDGYHLCELRD
jgi:hypothetical protein